jgi:hypothetical protein
MAEGLNKLSGLGALMKNRQAAAPTPAPAPAPVAVETPKVNPLASKLGGLGGLSKIKADPAPQPVKPTAAMSLDDFASMEDMGEIPHDLEHDSNRFVSAFTDETPADKPMREIPADCNAQMKLFIEMMDNMYDTELRQDLELLSGMIRSIMVELKSNPQYIQQVRKEDIRTWVQAMRQTMGLAKIKKAEKQEKRKGSGTRSPSKGKKTDDTFDDIFAELGISGE